MENKTVHEHSAPEDKIALFCSLFRGRDDVYARRFENRKTGKSGYQPACANEWTQGLCDKRSVKCAACPYRRFLEVSDEVIRWHLCGRDNGGRAFVMGLYPMLQDETCFFVAADFDKQGWQKDALTFVDTCHRKNLPAVLERSRSGNGGHVWLFFNEALPSGLARKLFSHILTETMERRPEMGLDSYDRLFPGQDTLPKAGFGNLIALPLQKEPRKHGNSVFVNEQLVPYPDQWAFLASVDKLSRGQVETIVSEAEARGQLLGVRLPSMTEGDDAPWTALPSRRRKASALIAPPKDLEIIMADQLYISKDGLCPALRDRLIRLAAFQNPEFYKTQALRLSTYGKSRIIACAEDYPHHIALPRGCIEDVRVLLKDLKIKSRIHDKRFEGSPITVSFHGRLRPEQKTAADAMAAHENGVLSATTAFGKTVIAAWLIACRGVNALVVVHRRQLLLQWVERLAMFLSISETDVGRIGGGGKHRTGRLDVALIQSLVRNGVVNDLVADYGHLVFDECHHLPAASFEQVARRVKAKYVAGLSATVTRKDGHHPIIFMQCGPVRHRVKSRQQALVRPFEHIVVVRPTGFQSLGIDGTDARIQFQGLYSQLLADEARNRLICRDVLQAVREGRSPVVLTERTAHLERLAAVLSPDIKHLIIFRGGMGKKALSQAWDQMATVAETEDRVVLATGKYIGEGFDDARLDTLFLTLPVSWRGTIAQYAGRLHRLHERKREVRIYDYADLDVPMLAKMFDRRCQGYEAIGYKVQLPASAVPGWPAEVALPVDPLWKQDYAASVRRLIRDGVDRPLAALFADVAGGRHSKSYGSGRARSASEAFLYRRLETLPQTAGKFELNARLPIPFDGQGSMEVDFFYAEGCVAIELDGDQHLKDPDAYRRDRRKDLLLQENGYTVLRFLAKDVGSHLDTVLDAIVRVMVNRRKRR